MPRRRRTQEERSAETRALLVDCAIECLSEIGYHAMTSAEIARRAGLSRGAQNHHFGSKNALVIAAMEDLYRRYNRQFIRKLEAVPDDADPAVAAIDILWEIMRGPAGKAYLELVAAARTEEELREPMSRLVERMGEGHDELFRRLFRAAPDSEGVYELIWTAVFAMMEGLALESIVRPDDDKVERVLTALKRMAPLAVRAAALRAFS